MAGFFSGAGSALIGGALSGISNLFGSHSQNQSVEKQLAAAREEAENTRKWQTYLHLRQMCTLCLQICF